MIFIYIMIVICILYLFTNPSFDIITYLVGERWLILWYTNPITRERKYTPLIQLNTDDTE